MQINKYIKSLQGGPPEEHHAFKTFLLIIGAVFAGYTASNFPPQFLLFFATPLGQFVTFMILGLGLYQTKNLEFVVYDSIIYVILLQILQYISKEIYKEQNKGEDDNKQKNDNKEQKNIIMASNEHSNNEVNNKINNKINKNNNNIIIEELF